MKNFIKSLAGIFVITSLIISSCSNPDNKVFKLIPESAMAVVSFHPGRLMEKGRIQEVEILKKEASKHELSKKLFENPESSGIEMDAYSAFFLLSGDTEYACFVMPLASKTNFELLLDEIEKESGEEMSKSNIGSYESRNLHNTLIVYNSSFLFLIKEMDEWSGTDLSVVAESIINLDKNEALITDKDFSNFLGKQKDMNAWISSNNLKGISDLGEGMDIFGGIKNNYGHIFADFQDGFMTMNTNLRFNASWQETIDKYNFMDEKAIKEVLHYIPSENLLFVGNTNIDSERIFDLLKFVNNDFERSMEEMTQKMGIDKDELMNIFSGEAAFSFNAIKTEDIESENISVDGLPTAVFASRIKNTKNFEDFFDKAKEEAEFTEKEGYYQVANGIPAFMVITGKDLVVSNNEEIIREIASEGKLKENVTLSEFGNKLSSNPVCFFLNLNRDSYTEEMKQMLDEKFPRDIPLEMDKISKGLESLSFSANLEEWEFRVDIKNKEQNFLYTLLSQLD